VVACADDAELGKVLPRLTRRTITYGIDAEAAEVSAADVTLEGFGARCTVRRRDPHRGGAPETLGRSPAGAGPPLGAERAGGRGRGPRAGRAVREDRGRAGGVPGAERRFERAGVVDGITVVDDYGHHPTEIAAVHCRGPGREAGARGVAFQPHRYTRTAT
jgi:UDP-N-acetylmuramate--alanine ligase